MTDHNSELPINAEAAQGALMPVLQIHDILNLAMLRPIPLDAYGYACKVCNANMSMYNVKIPNGHLTSIRFTVELYGSIAVYHASAVKRRLWLHVAEATVKMNTAPSATPW